MSSTAFQAVDTGKMPVLHGQSGTAFQAVDTGKMPVLHGLRILVVDDEPGVRDCLVRVLRYQGCEINAAQNAEEAFAALRCGSHYDVILVDLVMPDMEGLRLIRKMRSSNPSLRFIAVSGKPLTPAEKEDLARLGVPVCSKPFRNEELSQAVRDMARREARPEVVHAHA